MFIQMHASVAAWIVAFTSSCTERSCWKQTVYFGEVNTTAQPTVQHRLHLASL